MPIRRLVPLQQKKPWRPPRKALRQRSAKRDAFMREERVPLTREMLEENPWCDMAYRIREQQPSYVDCQRSAIGLHEIRKRSQGGSMTDRENLIRTCGPCNSWVEDHPLLAHAAGLVHRAGDAA